jgi:hypothetical protein
MFHLILILTNQVVGAAVLRYFTLAGYRTIIIEKKRSFFSHASAKNSGFKYYYTTIDISSLVTLRIVSHWIR